MRIGLVYRHFSLSGRLPRLSVELARYLSGRDHDVDVFSIAHTTHESLALLHSTTSPRRTCVPACGRRGSCGALLGRLARQVAHEPLNVVHARLPSTWEADVLYVGGVARGEALRGGVREVHWQLAQARHPHNAVRSWVERRAVRSARVMR
jgi:hypothetical protein